MDKKTKEKTIRRFKILAGQIRGVQGMVEKEKYCIDILRQTGAIKQAISGIEDLILKNHLSSHVVEQIKKGKQSKATKEILTIYKLSKKR